MVDQIEVLRRELSIFVETNKKGLALAIMANLTAPPPLGTPVKTGFARANWIPTVDSPFEGLAGTKEAALGGSLNLSLQASGIATLKAIGRNTKRGARGRFVSRKIIIANNVPYINRLNSGSSKQSPTAFVEIAIAKAKTDV